MLNQDTLAQLKGLKTQMESEKERAEAVIKGTQARYGFAVLDDGREIFIPPDEMLKAFPQDRVKICIRPTKDNKTVADIEALVDSPLGVFTGRCVRKGKALFVQPDLKSLSRWLFIPPHARNGVKEGDFLRCAVLRHPIRDGKPQAKVLAVIGDDDSPGIENLYCREKYQLASDWSTAARKDLEALLANCRPLETSARRDLSNLEFVSIDASKTQDIDDALYAESSSDGWTLYVAIADPTAYIEPGTALHAEIASRATSAYFHGDVIPMLPEELSQETCALSEGADRPALVCKIAVSDAGTIGDYEFMEATIRSRAKLSYYAVDRYLAGNCDELMSHATPLEALLCVYRALRKSRCEHELVMEDRKEFRWLLNDNKQIESIEPTEKLLSQRLVEECMVAANRCAAGFLTGHGSTGPFVSHPGFRSDRLDEARKFLAMHLPEIAEDVDLGQLQTYRDIMRALANPEKGLPLRNMVNRMLTRAELSTRSSLHMGMALPCYTNCTSPLRKYADFLVHQQIKAALHGKPADLVTKDMLSELSANLSKARSASQEAERWLAANYVANRAKTESQFTATVSHINSSGFTARLDDCGLEGFVDLRKDPEKFSFDKWQCSLTSTTRRFQLEQQVELVFTGVDAEQHQVQFKLVENCGLKPVKTVD